MSANIMNSPIFYGQRSLKVTNSSNFNVNPTLPLLDGLSSPLFLLLSLYIPLYLPLLLYAKINLHIAKCFWIRFLVRPLFKLYFAAREILRAIKGEMFSSSLSSPFHSLSLSLISPSLSYLPLSPLSFSLSLLSIFLSGVSNGRFHHCS